MYDESIDVSDAEEVATPPSSVSGSRRPEVCITLCMLLKCDSHSRASYYSEYYKNPLQRSALQDRMLSSMAAARRHSMAGDPHLHPGSSDQSENTDDDDEDDDDVKAAHLEGYLINQPLLFVVSYV